MALVTGGLGGLGLIASRELCVSGGLDKIVAVSRSGRAASGQLEDEILETLQEYAVHQIIRCDIADGAGLSDAFRFADGGQGPPQARAHPVASGPDRGAGGEHGQRDPERLDPLEILGEIADCLWEVHREGMGRQMGSRPLRRAARFRDAVARAADIAEEGLSAQDPIRSRPARVRLAEYRDKLEELGQAIEVLWGEMPGCAKEDGRPAGAAFAAQAAAAARGGAAPAPASSACGSSARRAFAWRRQGHREEEGEDGLLRRMEREMAGGGVPATASGASGEDGDPTAQGDEALPAASLATAAAIAELFASRAGGAGEPAAPPAAEEPRRSASRHWAAARLEEEERARRAKEEEEERARARRAEERRARAEAARRALEQPTCPAGHALAAFVVQEGFPCDACGAGAAEGDSFWGCRYRSAQGNRTCDYDVCERCKAEAVQRKLRSEARRRDRQEYDRVAREHRGDAQAAAPS